MRLTLSSLVIFQVILWTVLSPIIPVVTAIKLEPDGGYTGLVFKIHKDVPEDMCEDIIKQMKVRTIILISFYIMPPTNYLVGWRYPKENK